MKMRIYMVALFCMTASLTSGAEPVKDRGIYALWYGDDWSILETPFVTGGQIVCQWRDVEPEEGRHDFSIIERQLRQFKAMGRKTTIQINGNRKPEWLFDQVPYTPERLSVQVRDEKGTLMYWHPTHRNAYIRMLEHFAQFMRNSPDRDALIGIRLNFNAIGTEHLHVPDDYKKTEAWIVPTSADPGKPFSEDVNREYQDTVVTTFVEQIAPLVRVFVRNGIKPEIEERYRDLFESGTLGWFHTSSEAEPRSTDTEFRYMRFYRDCRSGKTAGFAEPWASAWGDHGGKEDHRPFSPPQWNYWRLLIDLHCGISYIGVYKSDLNAAIHGTYDAGDNHYSEKTDKLGYQAEFESAFKFASKYAGYHASPGQSPGAWAAFRDSHEILARNVNNEARLQLNDFTGDYNFLLERQPDSTTGVHNVGPDPQRYGAWARILPAGQKMTLKADPEFIGSLTKGATVRVIYLDETEKAGTRFYVGSGHDRHEIILRGSGRWETAEFHTEEVPNRSLVVEAGGKDLCIHMVEILRAD